MGQQPYTVLPTSTVLPSTRRMLISRNPATRCLLLLPLTLLLYYFISPHSPSRAPAPTLANSSHVELDSSSEPEVVHEAQPISPQFNAPDPCPNVQTTTQTPDGQTWVSPTPPLPLSASLELRLRAWESSPISHLSDWTRFNEQTCGISVERNLNRVHEEKGRKLWDSMDAEDVRRLRTELIEVLRTAAREGAIKVPATRKVTRGIVFTAGNSDTVARTIVSLRLLRSYGTTLPAEVFHFESEKPAQSQLDELATLGAVVRVAEGLDKQESALRTKSFHIKGSALLQSSFDQLLYLDSDSMATKDVTPLFDAPGYLELGVMLWSDFWKDSPQNPIWSILGVQCRDEFSTESGQILIDKRRHLDVLILVDYMLRDWPRFFNFSDGDKDLFRYAFLALRKRWAVPGRHIASASWLNEDELGHAKRNRFCGHTMLQHDHTGAPSFIHANLVKRLVGTLSKGQVWGRTHQLALPPPSALPSSFVLQADHLANVNNTTGLGILTAPIDVRHRAILESQLSTFFHDGHRSNAYVLCIDSKVRGLDTLWVEGLEESRRRDLADFDELDTDENDSEDTAEHEESSRVADKVVGRVCGVDKVSPVFWQTPVSERMEIARWEDDGILAGFEERFFEAGGKANGAGA